MALRVWLPLNGNLENKGLSKIIPSGAPTFLNDGKMGKCISLTPRVSFTGLPRLDNFTILFWLKVDSCSSDWADSLSFTSIQADDSSAAPFRFEATKTSRACSFHNNTPYAITTGSRILITEEQKGEWHHCGFSYDGEYCYTYIDGVLTYTDTGLGGYINNYFHIGETNNMVGGMNDLRIYDECLSQKQIKEISKGLVAHYKLEGVGANPNLLVNASNRGSWTYENCTRINDADPKVIGFSVSSANQRIYLGVTNVWNSGQKYIYSFDAKASVNDAQLDASRSIADFGPNHYLTTEWQHYSGKISSTTTADAGTLSIRGKTANVTYYLKNVKLENGEVETNYVPNINDAEYTTLGYENDICTDVSGNGYTATKNGTLTFNTDSPRYGGSTKFDGSTGYLAIGRPMPKDMLTINVWANMDNWANYNGRMGSCTEGGGWNFEPMSGAMNFALGVGASSNVYMTNFTSSQTPLSGLTSGWHMFTGTFDGIYKRIYIDGVLKGETNGLQNGTTLTSATPIFYNGSNGIFIGAEAGGSATTPVGNYFNGSISDFRIYATALSSDDILTMYKNSGIIDNKQNVYSYEFKEE